MKKKPVRRVAVYLYDIRKPHVGLGEMEHSLATELARLAHELHERYDVRLTFIVPRRQLHAYTTEVDYLGISRWMEPFFKWCLLRPLTRLLLHRFNLIHWTQQMPKLRGRFSPATLVTVHDVNFLHNDICPQSVRKRSRRIRRTLKIATHLAFVSQFTASDVTANFHVDKPWRIIPNGVTDLRKRVSSSRMAVPDNYLFHLSSLDEKKNPDLLVEMMRFLPGEMLVIAGGNDMRNTKRLLALVNRYQLRNVFFKGPVTTEEKAWLYANARAFLFPSRSEGFGLPVVEAMYFGLPTFVSRLTALPETGGDAAYYFDELSPEPMAHSLKNGLADYDAHRDERKAHIIAHAEQYNWTNCARQYTRYYLDILGIDTSTDDEPRS